MFQIYVVNQKVQKKEPLLRSGIFFLNAMIMNTKHTIFLILLKCQNLWNLINLFIKKL